MKKEYNNKRIIVKVLKNKEYLYDRKYYQVSNKNCDLVCAAMNKANYKLLPNEIWKVFPVTQSIWKEAFYKITMRNGKVYFYEIWNAR